MNTMKKCLLFVGLIGIMGAIKTNFDSSAEERIAQKVMYKIQQKESEKKEKYVKIAVAVFAVIGVVAVEFAIIDTFFFFHELSKNAATCAANCAKNVAEAAGKNAGDLLLGK